MEYQNFNRNKIRKYKIIVESASLFRAELWQVNKRNKFRIRFIDYAVAEQEWVQLRMQMNAEMRIGVYILETVLETALNWYEHIKRKSNNRWPKKLWE